MATSPVASSATPHPDFTEAQRKKYEELRSELVVDTDKLKRLQEGFTRAMDDGLANYGSLVPMIPAFVVNRLTGVETGTYLALDLGGTNARVCSAELCGNGEIKIISREFTVPDDKKVGEDKDIIFDFLAECVEIFLNAVPETRRDEKSASQELLMGFTFSFPLEQTAIDKGTIMYWNKNFDLPGAVNQDVVQLLQAALERKHLAVRVTAVVNDTVGCLLANAYRNPKTSIGVIFGTGTNAAYYARLPTISKWTRQHDIAADPATRGATEMTVNTEWGAYETDPAVLPPTRFDVSIDRRTRNPGKQLFEKLISGMYLGELVRLILVELIDERLLFDGHSSDEFNRAYAFHTSYLSEIKKDTSADLEGTRGKLEDVMGLPRGTTTLADRYFVREVCQLVAERAARLGGMALASILSYRADELREKDAEVAIGVDGSLYEKYPGFDKHIMDAMRETLGADLVDGKVTLGMVEDGSAKGAALAAMLAKHKLEATATV
ncbi:hexokinase-domain-containing protein [Syncephalis pseudoplumigaleata]|uniref:Phosphotransferase n=1 Tax=Syncephalis pseudoplumigaleata TaxID=1712513 RepID=A0A4V1J1T3_9FUNG|nr:hexokinase-domain-containing protein [Syncephalis pseudoplumigaleata]|eukprot:RKP26159.1 hexokinase-domain-containing protein [Syncephalis pseudoplumigaleata]